MFNHEDDIKVCDSTVHGKQIPLLWTFAFPGCEYWCPVCSIAGGMFGTGKWVKSTPILEQRLDTLKGLTNEYLKARGTLVADRIEVEGKMLSREEVPPEVYEKARAVVDAWTGIDESEL